MTWADIGSDAWKCIWINRVRERGRRRKRRKKGYVGKVDKFVLETNVKACGFKSHYP